jgi:hypothetical protein
VFKEYFYFYYLLPFYQDLSRYILKGSVMGEHKVKFSSQLDPKVLNKAKQVAKAEGRQLQSIIEEALTDYLERMQNDRPSTLVLNAFRESLQEYDQLYSNLAK